MFVEEATENKERKTRAKCFSFSFRYINSSAIFFLIRHFYEARENWVRQTEGNLHQRGRVVRLNLDEIDKMENSCFFSFF